MGRSTFQRSPSWDTASSTRGKPCSVLELMLMRGAGAVGDSYSPMRGTITSATE